MNERPNLTPKQKTFLEFINDFQERHGYPPSQPEIAQHFGYKSLGTVQDYLQRLKEHGHLEHDSNARRGIKVTNDNHHLPLMGRVAAGRPIEALLHQETIEVPPSFLKKGFDYFALEVKGDSMIGEGILDGDKVVVRKQVVARNGETVIAMIENEATVKKFFKQKDKIELRSANSNYKPIIVRPSTPFKIEGIVVGVLRYMGVA
ncbi:MAG: transcriptional repressor LexA [Pseudomonadota bacterium]|nr:transcriptional repressor LexA [Pseudomonadota bacterium]